MSMSKKDFIALADTLRAVPPVISNNPKHAADETRRRFVDALADFCARQNPLFKRARWVDYLDGKCGPGGKVLKPEAC